MFSIRLTRRTQNRQLFERGNFRCCKYNKNSISFPRDGNAIVCCFWRSKQIPYLDEESIICTLSCLHIRSQSTRSRRQYETSHNWRLQPDCPIEANTRDSHHSYTNEILLSFILQVLKSGAWGSSSNRNPFRMQTFLTRHSSVIFFIPVPPKRIAPICLPNKHGVPIFLIGTDKYIPPDRPALSLSYSSFLKLRHNLRDVQWVRETIDYSNLLHRFSVSISSSVSYARNFCANRD